MIGAAINFQVDAKNTPNAWKPIIDFLEIRKQVEWNEID